MDGSIPPLADFLEMIDSMPADAAAIARYTILVGAYPAVVNKAGIPSNFDRYHPPAELADSALLAAMLNRTVRVGQVHVLFVIQAAAMFLLDAARTYYPDDFKTFNTYMSDYASREHLAMMWLGA